jgi:hypothetical protein
MAGPDLESSVAIGRSAGKVYQICRKSMPSVAKNETLPKKWPRADFAPRKKTLSTCGVFEIGQRVQQTVMVFGDQIDAVEYEPSCFPMRADVGVEVDAKTFHPFVDLLEDIGVHHGDDLGAPQRARPDTSGVAVGSGWRRLGPAALGCCARPDISEPLNGTSSRMNFGKVLTYPRASVACPRASVA